MYNATTAAITASNGTAAVKRLRLRLQILNSAMFRL